MKTISQGGTVVSTMHFVFIGPITFKANVPSSVQCCLLLLRDAIHTYVTVVLAIDKWEKLFHVQICYLLFYYTSPISTLLFLHTHHPHRRYCTLFVGEPIDVCPQPERAPLPTHLTASIVIWVKNCLWTAFRNAELPIFFMHTACPLGLGQRL